MRELKMCGKEIKSVFQLIGTNENDITKSIAWGLTNCPVFLKGILKEVLKIDIDPSDVMIMYQESESEKGITDLELTNETDFYLIIEAKKGWLLPDEKQLTLYSKRKNILESKARYKAIISMSECSSEYADAYLPFQNISGLPILHLPMRSIFNIANESIQHSTIKEKNLLKELMQYLGGIMKMQEKTSNWVYIVSLSKAKPKNCDLTWIEIVEKCMKYFHPVGTSGWPKEPLNYIAFRYDGRLQSIHHIEDYVVTENLHEEIAEMPDIVADKKHFVYKLGAGIIPSKIVKTGNIYASGRKRAMLDTLLTADSIEEACNISKERMR